jgi:hypothetical protein
LNEEKIETPGHMGGTPMILMGRMPMPRCHVLKADPGIRTLNLGFTKILGGPKFFTESAVETYRNLNVIQYIQWCFDVKKISAYFLCHGRFHAKVRKIRTPEMT